MQSCFRHAYAVTGVRRRSEIANNNQIVFTSFRTPHKRDDGVLRIVEIDPFEARRLEVNLVKGGLASIEIVQSGAETLKVADGPHNRAATIRLGSRSSIRRFGRSRNP